MEDEPCSSVGAAPTITYDSGADAAYIYLVPYVAPGRASHQVVVEGVPGDSEIVLDFDSEGRILGIEIIGARSCLTQDLLRSAVAIDSNGVSDQVSS